MMSTVTDTVVSTTEALLPAILMASGAGAAVSNAAAIAPAVIQALQMASIFQKAGYMTPEQLAAVFADIGKSVQTTHDAWNRMNAKVVQAA